MKGIRTIVIFILLHHIGPLLTYGGTTDAINYTPKEVEHLYKKCQTRPDLAITNTIIFLNEHQIRKDKAGFYRFFEEIGKIDTDPKVSRRLAILFFYGGLRFKNIPENEVKEKFDAMFEDNLKFGDHGAIVEGLLELALYYQSHGRKDLAIKNLFYAEKLVSRHHLESENCYQKILHHIGYLLWDFNHSNRSNQYFRKALFKGTRVEMDSLIALNAIAMNYQKMDSIMLSNQYFLMANKYAMKTENKLFSDIVLGNLSKNYLKNGIIDSAVIYSTQYKRASIEHRLYTNVVDAYQVLINIDLKRDDIKVQNYE